MSSADDWPKFFFKNLKIQFFIAIWFDMKNALKMGTNKPSIGPVALEIAPEMF